MNTTSKKIGLVADSHEGAAKSFFKFLVDSFPGVFVQVKDEDLSSLAGIISYGGDFSPRETVLPFLVISPSTKSVEKPRVQFEKSSHVPSIFRGRPVKQKKCFVLERTSLANGEEPLGTVDGQAFWSVRAGGYNRRFECAVSPSHFENPLLLFQHLAADSFAQFLPILDFIRSVRREEGWTPPPMRAQIMFDDPNLHSLRYGWLDYAKLIASASRHNYHASFATIPLDAWFTSAKSAQLFRENSRRLSLLVHGNNHLKQELATYPTAEAAIAGMGQALNRIRKLERQSGVAVSRVVAAPHGACSEQTLGVLARLGYESACISHGSLFGHNKDKEWTRRIGVAPAEIVAGTPVIPRFRVEYDCVNSVLLSAYLDQPIVPVGHHGDVSDGMKMVETVAGFINSLGDVQWMDMKAISRSNYYSHQKQGEIKVRTFARVFEIKLPANIKSLSIQRPWLGMNDREGLRITSDEKEIFVSDAYQGESIPVHNATNILIESIHPESIDASKLRGRLNARAFARRALCEIRDRVAPMFGS